MVLVPWIRIRGYLFGLYSAEPIHEPPHVHVTGKGGSAKFWLGPVRVVFSTYTRNATREIVDVVNEREQQLMEAWREHFSDR